jgi:hypothetical protein
MCPATKLDIWMKWKTKQLPYDTHAAFFEAASETGHLINLIATDRPQGTQEVADGWPNIRKDHRADVWICHRAQRASIEVSN